MLKMTAGQPFPWSAVPIATPNDTANKVCLTGWGSNALYMILTAPRLQKLLPRGCPTCRPMYWLPDPLTILCRLRTKARQVHGFIRPRNLAVYLRAIVVLLAQFLQGRTFRGLEQNLGQDTPSVLEQGRSGVAQGYSELS